MVIMVIECVKVNYVWLFQTYETVLEGSCTENGPSCNKGLALFELRIHTRDGKLKCNAPKSEV